MTDRNKRWFGLLDVRISRRVEEKASSAGEKSLLAADLSDHKSDPHSSKPLRPEPMRLSARVGPDALSAEETYAPREVQEARAGDVLKDEESRFWPLETSDCEAMPALDNAWIEARPPREQSLLRLILTQDVLRAAVTEGPIVELRAAADEKRNSLFPIGATVEVNSGDAKQAQEAVRGLRKDLGLIFLHNVLQFLSETRQFIGLCFSKLAIGGTMIVATPHQFLYERKLRLPSRRNPLHRRFYTPNTLLADVEEAIDPSEFRVRFLCDSDIGYTYRTGLNAIPEGGQDILLAIERIAQPSWRSEMDSDEIWAGSPTRPTRFLPVDKKAPAPVRIVAPDPRGVNSVIVMKLDHRGDFMMAMEAFKVLRNAFDQAEITLVCGSWNAAEAERTGYFEHILPFDFFPEDDSARTEMPSRERLIEDFAQRMAGKSYDLAIDLRLYDDTRELLHKIDARNRAGFDRFDEFPWMTIRLNTPSATVDDRAESAVMPATAFHTALGNHRTFEIAFDTLPRFEGTRTLLWGPYQDLNPGRYTFECLIEPLAEDFDIAFDIVKDSGTKIVAAGILRVARSGRPRLQLDVVERLLQFEFRLFAGPAFDVKPFRFLGLRYVRPGVIRGVHQAEGMALLAHLVQLRMHDAFTTELI
jgi:hypothetical protein